jgi:hypothetical protein
MSSSRALRAGFVAFAFTFAPLAAAGTLTVGPAGSGAQFTQIQAAIDAALDDDVILVKPGTYASIVVDKPLRILGDGTGTVRIQASGGAIPVQISGIATLEELVLSGMEAVSPDEIPAQVILVQSCPGTVVLQDVVVPRTNIIGVLVESCGRVLVLDSRIDGGQRAVLARNSELWISNSDITGVPYGLFLGSGTFPSTGVELVSSRLHLWRSRIQSSAAHPIDEAGPTPGAAGIKAFASIIDLFGGPGTSVVGGPGATFDWATIPAPGGAGLDLFQSSRARIQDDAVVQGGLDGLGLVRAPAVRVDGTSSFTLDPKVFPTLVSSAQQVTLGSTVALTLTGNPGGYQVLFASLRTGPTTIYRRVDGFGMLDRPNMMRVATEVLPPSGTFTLTLRVPNMPALIGATFFLQAAEQVGNSYAIGNPALVTITG